MVVSMIHEELQDMRESAKAAISVPKQPERKKLEKLRKKGLENEGKGSVVKRAAMSGKAEKVR